MFGCKASVSEKWRVDPASPRVVFHASIISRHEVDNLVALPPELVGVQQAILLRGSVDLFVWVRLHGTVGTRADFKFETSTPALIKACLV